MKNTSLPFRLREISGLLLNIAVFFIFHQTDHILKLFTYTPPHFVSERLIK